jgi:hypothetical protein
VHNRGVVDVLCSWLMGVADQHLYCVRRSPPERYPGYRWTTNIGRRGVCVRATRMCPASRDW